jgi:hypothetical protein
MNFASYRNARRIAIGGALSAGVTVLVLTGCGGVKSSITKAINQELSKEKVCYSLQQKEAPTWPLRVRRSFGWGGENQILNAMQAAGYLQVTQEQQQQGWGYVVVDVITPTEQAKKWWNNQDGYCVGTKAVAEIQEWAPPNGPTLRVTYTWRLVNVPSWAKRPEFKDIPGMSKPVQGMAIVQKTNKGWKVVF